MMGSVRFGLFDLDPASGELKKSGIPVKLRQQPSKVLALLASDPGRLFTREEIQSAVWGEGTHVDFEQGLNYCIKEIRAALGDRAETPTYVETVARRGYRFIASVVVAPPAETPAAPARPPRRRTVWLMFAAAAAALALSIVGFMWTRPGRSARLTIAVLPFENLTGEAAGDTFTTGLTEEAHIQLGRLQPSRLAVLARTTSRNYTKLAHPIAALSHDFGVDYVLEGSVRRCAKHARLRVTARLIRASNRRQVWSDTLHEPLDDDAVEMQRSLGRDLANRIGAALAVREPSITPTRVTEVNR